ncbi:DUF2188 domain-containing protein, partial [Escherichia coli]|nr:DUF2188 domain-containing protein [Escherichia coli]
MGKDQHVVPHDGGWAVKGAGNSKATSISMLFLMMEVGPLRGQETVKRPP